MTDNTTDYINTVDYTKLESRIKDLVSSMDELSERNAISRRLRYVDVDIEGERARGKLQPDELIIPQHIIDSNIRREQSSYIQYETQSPRAVILQDIDDPAIDTSLLEKDVTTKLRFNGWQLPTFANIDGFQQNGYSIIELVLDQSQPGELAYEAVQLGDFGMVADTKDIQESEILGRNYYFSKTRLLAMTLDEKWGFDSIQTNKVIDQQPNSDDETISTNKNKSLYKIQKVMFRVNGVVHVAWCRHTVCDGWLRAPRPLYIGRRQLKQQPTIIDMLKAKLQGLPPSESMFETQYPYFLYPYLISENNTISQLKGRAFLDQDTQQAAMSMISSLCTGLRRASGLYFSKDAEDPNDDLLLQKNIFFKSGALINSKIKSFQLNPPPTSEIVNAVSMLVSNNKQETSQVNFAEVNRQGDSRKTATAVNASMQMAQQLSTVQVVLYSNASKALKTTMFEIIKSRVITGLLKVNPQVAPMYQRNYIVKPSGDIDVIERQQLVQAMMSAWPVMQSTPASVAFLSDLISKMFPEYAAKYLQIFQQAQIQQQSAQAQQQQQLTQGAALLAKGIVDLSKHPEYFSDIGKIHSLPQLEQTAQQIEQLQETIKQ